MSQLSYKTVVEELLKAVPAFRSTSSEWDADLPHEVFGIFTLHFCSAVRTGRQPDLVESGLRFFSRMAEAGDEEVLNLLVVSVLELVADDSLCKQVFHEGTTDKVQALLERVSRGWPPSH